MSSLEARLLDAADAPPSSSAAQRIRVSSSGTRAILATADAAGGRSIPSRGGARIITTGSPLSAGLFRAASSSTHNSYVGTPGHLHSQILSSSLRQSSSPARSRTISQQNPNVLSSGGGLPRSSSNVTSGTVPLQHSSRTRNGSLINNLQSSLVAQQPPPERSFDGDRAADEERLRLDFTSPALPQSPSTTSVHSNHILSSNQQNDPAVADPLNVLKHYTRGQLSSAVKTGIWWCAFGPVMLALLDGRVFGVGATRISFNIALLLASPIAAVFVERTTVRSLLLGSTAVRLALYSILLPLVWVLLATDWIITSHSPSSTTSTDVSDNLSSLLPALCVLVFADGFFVSISNLVDIDSDGMRILARQHFLTLKPGVREKASDVHEKVFESAMILLAPIGATIAWVLCEHIDWPTDQQQRYIGSGASLLLVLATLFLISSVISLNSYRKLPILSERHLLRSHRAEECSLDDGSLVFTLDLSDPRDRAMSMDGTEGDLELSPNVSRVAEQEQMLNQTPFCTEVYELFASLGLGARLCFQQQNSIRGKLWLLAAQTALEDALICLLLPVAASYLLADISHASRDRSSCVFAAPSLLAICLAACGKLGGLIANKLRTGSSPFARWIATQSSTPKKTDRFIGLCLSTSTVFLMLIPMSLWLLQTDLPFWISSSSNDDKPFTYNSIHPPLFRRVACISLVALASVCFFLLSTLPKMLLATAIQTASADVANAEAERQQKQNETIQNQLYESQQRQQAENDRMKADSNFFSVDESGDYDLNATRASIHSQEQISISSQQATPTADPVRAMFGFVAAFLTGIDSLFLIGLSCIFSVEYGSDHSLSKALYLLEYKNGWNIAATVIFAHGMLALLFSCCCSAPAIEDDNMDDDEVNARFDEHQHSLNQSRANMEYHPPVYHSQMNHYDAENEQADFPVAHHQSHHHHHHHHHHNHQSQRAPQAIQVRESYTPAGGSVGDSPMIEGSPAHSEVGDLPQRPLRNWGSQQQQQQQPKPSSMIASSASVNNREPLMRVSTAGQDFFSTSAANSISTMNGGGLGGIGEASLDYSRNNSLLRLQPSTSDLSAEAQAAQAPIPTSLERGSSFSPYSSASTRVLSRTSSNGDLLLDPSSKPGSQPNGKTPLGSLSSTGSFSLGGKGSAFTPARKRSDRLPDS